MSESPTSYSWPVRHLDNMRESFSRLLLKPMAALLTISVMALAISLPLGLWLTLGNLERLSGAVERSRAIDLFLNAETSHDRAEALARQLRAWDDVASVEHQTPEQGLDDLGTLGLDWASDLLRGESPLPHLLRVTPLGDDVQLIAALGELSEVELMQHDTAWRQQVDGWLYFGNRLVWVLGALFGLGSVLVVGNTVRLDFLSRREEMGVLQLLGASDVFIRRPFVYLGLWYGLLAGISALVLLTLAREGLRTPLSVLVRDYNSNFMLNGFSVQEILSILVASTLLGGLGARLVSNHLLRRNGSR